MIPYRILLATMAVSLMVASGAARVSAQTPVVHTAPPHNAVLTRAPKAIEITFDQPVQLQAFKVRTFMGTLIKIPFEVGQTAAAKTVTVPLPQLPPDIYTVEWRAHGLDTYEIAGSFSFTVAENN